MNQTPHTPRLRFPEFQDAPAWEEKKLGEVLTERTTRNKDTLYTEVFSIAKEKGVINQIEHLGRSYASKEISNYRVVFPFDIVYTKSPLSDFPWGIIKQNKTDRTGVVSVLYGVFKPQNPSLGLLIEAYFSSSLITIKHLNPIVKKGAKNTINITNSLFLDKIQIVLPSLLAEQRKIAACLSSLDTLIAAERRRLAALREHKKALLQNLFPQAGETTPRLRFPEFQDAPAWEEKKLGEVFTSFSGGTPSTSNKKFYGGEIPFIRSAEINKSTTELYLTEEGLKNSSAKKVKQGDLLIALYGANSGDVAISKIDGAINQAILCMKSEHSNNFAYQFLSLKKEEITSKYLQGGQGNLSGEIIKSIEIPLHALAEQQKIAACLSSLDGLIGGQAARVSALEEQKRGLLQGLFP